ncbi:MAG: response regulator [Syntrophobacteraceae bacterium]|jgi:signal transduction histidine kinase|nr:response regulator [Syntrophobacteraceae bacterium]
MDAEKETLKVLLVENSEDGYILVRDLLRDAPRSRFDLDWARDYEMAIREFDLKRHDAYLVDYDLSGRNGLDILQEALQRGCRAPLVLLTGRPERDMDIAAVRAGASDYLIKSEITPRGLERSIRYAIERKRAEETLRDSQHQLRHLSAELLHVQEEERKLIASELHGNLGQLLVAVKLGVENTLAHLKQRRFSSKRLEPLVPVLQHAIEEVRQLYTRLRPIILDDLGIVATLEWYCREFGGLHPEVEVDAAIEVHEAEVPEDLKVILYRLVQDALEITINGGAHKKVVLILRKDPAGLTLSITVNPYPGQPSHIPAGLRSQRSLTLAAMRERTILSGGGFSGEADESGTMTTRMTWPV